MSSSIGERELFVDMNDTADLTDSEDERYVSNEILDGNIKTDVAHRFKYE